MRTHKQLYSCDTAVYTVIRQTTMQMTTANDHANAVNKATGEIKLDETDKQRIANDLTSFGRAWITPYVAISLSPAMPGSQFTWRAQWRADFPAWT